MMFTWMLIILPAIAGIHYDSYYVWGGWLITIFIGGLVTEMINWAINGKPKRRR